MEEGLDTFVVIDGLPKVPEDSRPKLIKFLLRKLTTAGKTKEENVFMPMDDATQQTGGYAFVEYETPAQAVAAVKALNGTPLDKKHTIAVNKLQELPLIVDGELEARKCMNLSLSCDHRVVDGWDAASFLQDVKGLIENPVRLLSL